MSKNIRFTPPPPPPPPPPKNRDKSKNLRSVTTALRASTLSALGLLIALAVLLPNAAAEAQTSPTSTPSPGPLPPPETLATTDYDSDNDGLIDIKTLAQLNAVRYDLDGNGDSTHADYIAAFPNRNTTATGRMGCPSGTCSGYELMEDDLDFDADGNGIVEDTELYSNWTPIGTATSESTRFNATFKSNSADAIATISNLTIKDSSKEVGLFGATGPNARIERIGLVDVYVKPSAALPRDAKIGALVGDNKGKIIACYSTGAIDATAGSGSYAGGLVGYNTGTIDAAFSRATVDLEMEAGAIGGSTNIYAGGLAGHNEGTLTATYAAGAVKGKGGRDGYVGGLVGYNITPSDATSATKTIVASYSIAPVTAVPYATTANASKPEIGGLTGCCTDSTTITNTITASYWDYIASGVPDDSDTAMPEGKTTADLISPTSASGIYAGWDKLTIDGVNNVAPWEFSRASAPRQHPWLTYGGHTRAGDLSGNQHIAPSNIKDNSGGRNTGHPREGMSLESSLGISSSLRFRGGSVGGWTWQGSTDGITWTTLSLGGDGASRAVSRGAAGSFRFVPRQEHINKYIRAKRQLTTGDFVYTRVMGKIKPAATTAAAALGFASGDNPPRVGTGITVAALPSGATDARGLWYRCDTNTSTSSGCDLVGSLRSYIPGAADLNHYIRADIYYNKDNTWTRSSTGFTTKKVADRFNQWRAN